MLRSDRSDDISGLEGYISVPWQSEKTRPRRQEVLKKMKTFREFEGALQGTLSGKGGVSKKEKKRVNLYKLL